MNWKVFITAFVSASLLALPQNSFTCGPSEDPYDYYTSFFSNKAGTSDAYKPFYYTGLLTFYDDGDWQAREDTLSFVNKKIAEEWAAYGGSSRVEDAINLVYLTKSPEMSSLLSAAQSGKAVTGSLAKNSVAQNFAKEKKAEAVNYLLFTSKTENSSSSDGWEDRKKDSLQLNKYIADATEAYNKTTDPFIKNKYAFQRCKLAFYNNRHNDCIKWYDAHFTDDNTSAVNELALSYKAGSCFRLGKNKEAAYAFSKTFMLSDQNKRSNFLGFMWATNNCDLSLVEEYTALCKNNKEKAAMIGLFALHGSDYRLDNFQKVYALDASSPLLPLLLSREINKLEEQYFTPMLSKEKGGKELYVSWGWRGQDENGNPKPLVAEPVMKAAQVFEKTARDKAAPNSGLYSAGAAYLYFVSRDYAKAKAVLAATKSMEGDAKVKDQLSLINLLIAANEGKTITAETEALLLPSMKWLTEKAKKDKEYALFCRNFFSQILAQKYEQQADAPKAALAYGMADLSFITRGENDYYYSYPPAIDFVRNEMNTAELLKLYDVTTKPQTEIQKFFVQNASVKRDGVIDVIGTSYLRDRDYTKAIEWLSKASKLDSIRETQYNYDTGKEITLYADPLHDYLNDWQRFSKTSATPYTKLTLAKKLLELQTKAESPTAVGDKSRTYYQLASALYNMSYYGNSWEAVAYDRSGTDWNEGTYKLEWQKEYYGVYKAKDYYQKAYETATDKEFKAACLFMAAKCAQRQIPRPGYDYNNYEKYDKDIDAFYVKFMANPLFARFKSEFGTTKFYQYTYNRCSYLRDYVLKSSGANKVPMKPKPKPKG